MSEMKMPDFLPLLGHGNHESPREGACVMEYVSVIAGEKWTDNPECTHPLLASPAVAFNDNIRAGEDALRSRLMLPLVPLLIGTNPNNVRFETRWDPRASKGDRLHMPKEEVLVLDLLRGRINETFMRLRRTEEALTPYQVAERMDDAYMLGQYQSQISVVRQGAAAYSTITNGVFDWLIRDDDVDEQARKMTTWVNQVRERLGVPNKTDEVQKAQADKTAEFVALRFGTPVA